MKEHDAVKVYALGGVGEIGKNMYCIEINDAIFVVDAGLMFPEVEMFGIDIVIPDTSYLVSNASRVQGIFLTHGHEDHIGGLPYVLRNLHVPVYGTKLTLGLVEDKLNEAGLKGKCTLIEISSETELHIADVKVSFFKTTHSIPDSVGVCFHTSLGAVIYTGDFKFDQTPVDPTSNDIGKMAAIGNEGVLCLLSDSTNAEREGYTLSERIVGKELSNIVYKAKGRVIVASFASNVHRLQQVIDASVENKRKVAVVGRSMVRVVDIASRLGYLQIPEDTIVPIVDIDNYPENNLCILTTGSQGEPMAALSRMAKGNHRQVTIKREDTVILAATPIPGNEIGVSKTVDLLSRSGANVIYGDKKTHVSGHASQEELKLMLNLMRPKYFIPVHGEFKMQRAHAKLAEEVGLSRQQIFLVEKGDVVEFKNNDAELAGRVPAGNILIDGSGVGDVGNIVLRDRRLLSQDGILVVVVTINKFQKTIESGPEIISRGFVYVRESEKLISDANGIVLTIVENAIRTNNLEWSSMKVSIREQLSSFLYEKTRRRPMILPIIMEV